jgi:hypothetical protein
MTSPVGVTGVVVLLGTAAYIAPEVKFLFRCLLTAGDQDFEIVIRRNPLSRKAGRISVVAA